MAITDGARCIRLFLQSIFPEGLFILLDWYHLQQKVTGLLTMISPNKEEKQEHILKINAFLWQGQVEQASTYLKTITQVRNVNKQQELLSYLDKHQSEIIDYQTRQKAGKPIGSGRGEKANDRVVAHRQKKKGMSWSKKGSRALAILKVDQINQQLYTKVA